LWTCSVSIDLVFTKQKGKRANEKGERGEEPDALRTAAVHLRKVGQLLEDGFVAKWHVDHAMMGKHTHRRQRGTFLSTSLTVGRDEEASVLTLVGDLIVSKRALLE
jgi:hypothetical protein